MGWQVKGPGALLKEVLEKGTQLVSIAVVFGSFSYNIMGDELLLNFGAKFQR